MSEGLVILVADSDDSHFWFIKKNLVNAGLANKVIQFRNGKELLDFLFMRGAGPKRVVGKSYILLIDIQIGKVNGVEVLKQIRDFDELRLMPIIVVTKDDEPEQMNLCYSLGCNIYIVKPADSDKFGDSIQAIGNLFSMAYIPTMN